MLILQLIIVQVVTFVALVFVLRKIMYTASSAETRRLQLLNEENVRKAGELAKKIEAAEAEYKEKISRAEEEAKKLRARADEEVEKLKDEILNKAREESERIVQQALNTKERVRDEIKAELQKDAEELSLRMIQEVLGSETQKALHEGLVEGMLQEIGRLEMDKFAINADKGELILPYPMDKNKKERVISALSKKAGKKVSLKEQIDKGVIAGIIIRLGSVIIDGSLAGKFKEAAKTLRHT